MASSNIDWKALEEEIDRAIGPGYLKTGPYHIDFASKSMREIRYIRTYVETKLSDTQNLLAVIIFLMVVGISFVPLAPILLKSPIYGYIMGYIIILIAFILFFVGYQPLNKKCRRIILEAEKRILSEDSTEPDRQQETTPALPQAQVYVPAKGGSIDKIKYIKNGLDSLKMSNIALCAAMLGLGVYYLEANMPNLITINFAIIATVVTLGFSCWIYYKLMHKLKNLA